MTDRMTSDPEPIGEHEGRTIYRTTRPGLGPTVFRVGEEGFAWRSLDLILTTAQRATDEADAIVLAHQTCTNQDEATARTGAHTAPDVPPYTPGEWGPDRLDQALAHLARRIDALEACAGSVHEDRNPDRPGF